MNVNYIVSGEKLQIIFMLVGTIKTSKKLFIKSYLNVNVNSIC